MYYFCHFAILKLWCKIIYITRCWVGKWTLPHFSENNPTDTNVILLNKAKQSLTTKNKVWFNSPKTHTVLSNSMLRTWGKICLTTRGKFVSRLEGAGHSHKDKNRNFFPSDVLIFSCWPKKINANYFRHAIWHRVSQQVWNENFVSTFFELFFFACDE